MNAVTEDVKNLVCKELESANKQFPLFQSPHEGYAVLLEEIEELDSAKATCESSLACLWHDITSNYNISTMLNKIYDIRHAAVVAACEAIQVAAMCDKFIMSFKDKV